MQHSAVDLENYARLYVADRLRESERQRRLDEAAGGGPSLVRAAARVQGWFTGITSKRASPQPAEMAQPVQLVPLPKARRAASADPYAGMIVLVRGPKSDAA